MLGYFAAICVFAIPSNTIRVPTSWTDEEVFLPYYGVVDGLPNDKSVDTYYPLLASNSVLRDQVVQNDEVIKLFQTMNPNLTILFPHFDKNSGQTPSNSDQQIYSQPVTTQNVYSDSKKSIKIPLKKKVILQQNLSRRPTPFKAAAADNQSNIGVNHENPGWIPTKPIYPGEGQWARKGVKHQPHITKNVFNPSPIDVDSSPGIQFYKKQKIGLQDEFRNFPRKHKLQHPQETTSKDEDYEEATTEEFVPYRTYAQVRHTESEKHVPRKKSQPRLRESVKDSKIHTLYTEEGYEDSAYDHADQEKNAERIESENKKSKNKTENHDKIVDNIEETVIPPKEPISPLDNEENSKEKEEERDNSEEEDAIREDVGKNVDNTSTKDDLTSFPKESFKHFGNPKKFKEDRHGSESNYNDDDIKFDITKTRNDYNEEALIDSVMDESKFGKKIKLKKRIRRSVKIDISKQVDQKYPYYNARDVDPLSSLRYSEISDNIPKKNDGSMSFYDKADKVECPEINDVDPVTDKVKNAESNTISKNVEHQRPSRRLNNLGDQIDCLKARYFGEDPFDNPLFKEENIDEPSSIFKQTKLTDVARFNSDVVEGRSTNVDNILDSGNDNSTKENLPEPLPYIVRRIYKHPPPRYIKRHKIYSKPYQRPQHKRQQIIIQHATTTHRTTPKTFKRISEVHYKDEIKPNEQMNVFADVINNIKNSSEYIDAAATDVRPVTVKVHANKDIPHRKRSRPRISTSSPVERGISYEYGDESNSNYYNRLSTTTQPFHYTSDDEIYEEVPKRYRKRKRRPAITTEMEQIEDITEQMKVNKRRIRPEYISNVNNLPDTFKPDIIDGFRPMLQDDVKEANHKAEYHEIDIPAVNQYYYIGMRPPPEMQHVHPTYYLKNQVKRRRPNKPPRKRFTRSTRGYAEIQRGRQNQEEPKITEKEEKQEEEDDYVPHRVRNFHYDEKTGKIIYDKKPKEEKEEEEEEEIEYEYVEVEEPTHPPPPKKEVRRIWPTKYPDGPNYLDYIKKLKDDSTYVQILDPQPTEKPKDVLITTDTSQITSSTGLPEYLSILNKVRTDKTYKFIEDPTENNNRSKTRTTTPYSLGDDDKLLDDASEEYIQEDVQNAPGVQGVFGKESQIQTSDTSDSTPNPRNYNPRTSVDTSKYTSIQRRPITRNKISSKYNSEALSNETVVEVTQKSKGDTEENKDELLTTTLESFTVDIPTTSIPSTTPVKSVETTNAKRVLISRRRGTTTASPSTSNPKRATISRQRQRGRNRFSTISTTEVPIQEVTRSRRNLSRRNYANSLVPRNHKSHYSEAQNVRNIKPTPRSITLNILKQTDFIIKSKNDTNKGSNHLRSENETKSENVEVDQNQRLGDKENSKKVELLADIETFSDVSQPQKDIEERDKKTKTDEVEVFKDYDKNQRHGGNYKYDKAQSEIIDINSESGGTGSVRQNANRRSLEDVEDFKDYDKNQKHGGNYKYKKVQIKITRNYKPYSKESREVDVGSDRYPEYAHHSETYYTDPKLPSHINNLKESHSNFDALGDYEENENVSAENENDYYEEPAVAHSRSRKENIPKFIKDPSKRLYYYAPV